MIVAILIGLLLSVVSTYGFSVIVEYALIKHVMDDAIKGLVVSIILGWIITLIWGVYFIGFGTLSMGVAVGGLIGALALAYPGIRRRRNQQRAEAQVAQTFE